MPNPLTRMQVTSKEPPKRPEAIPPEPEHYAGDNQPYRGINDHGVKATEKPSPTQADWDTREGRTYLPPEEEYEPIPVRIVQQHGNEFRQFRVHRMSVDNTHAVQLVGRNLGRQSLYISNPDAANALFISHEREMPLGGFILAPGQNATLFTHDEIYALGMASGAVAANNSPTLDLITSQAGITAAGTSASVTIPPGNWTSMEFQLNVTAIAGAGASLTATVQESPDGINWSNLQAFAAATAVGAQLIKVNGPFSNLLRVTWTVVAGTTVSFTVNGIRFPIVPQAVGATAMQIAQAIEYYSIEA